MVECVDLLLSHAGGITCLLTQASIYDFQPWVLNGVVEPPYNPLTISQTCVRFNDIDNVGKTGRHFTFLRDASASCIQSAR